MDYTVSTSDCGKPTGADLSLGLATAPVLYATEEYPELWEMMDRKFAKEGDIERVNIIFIFFSLFWFFDLFFENVKLIGFFVNCDANFKIIM